MSLVFLYEAGLSATSEDISDRCRKYALEVSQNASEGGIGASTITIDDPNGDYEIKGFRRLRIYEDEAVDDVDDLVYNGFIVARKVIRGPYRTGAARQWVCQMVDMNAVADFRIMYGSDANRPAEDDTERLAWLLGTSEAEFITNDDLVDTSSPVAMSKADYRGQRLSDVIRDCAQQSNNNWFIYTVEGASLSLGLWYAKPDWAQYTSDIRLSNDLDDIIGDDLTYEFSLDADLDIDPDRVYSGALGQWDGGTVYEEDAGISAEFTRRDAIVPMENVKTAAKATARALRYLEDFDTEERRITCSVRLPPARVNWIREGMRLQFRATHYPGFQGDFHYQRVLTRTVRQDSEVNYLLNLVLTAEPSNEGPPAGPAEVNFYGDNGVEVWINGTFIGDNSADHKTIPIDVADGILVDGDNVLAIRVTNGVEPATWALGNPTYLEARLLPTMGGLYVSTASTVKTWDVENLAGTLGGTPTDWNEVVFDDSGWDDAIDVTDDSVVLAVAGVGPISPARYVAPPGAPSGTYGRGLVWLARMTFSAS